jgi:uncharacterized protein YdeI (YjbR/CyaY-like superfamily)
MHFRLVRHSSSRSMTNRGVVGKAFRDAAAFRKWLEANHASERELVVKLYKVHAKEKGMTYAQALDEALCFGWIDGVRRGGDEESFSIRFTPRTARSTWSAVNIKRATELDAAGRMHESGLTAFRKRSAERSGIYAYENRQTELTLDYAKKLRSNKTAWKFFESQPPWYRRTAIYWVMSAKKEETRERRLASLIEVSAKAKPLPQLDRTRT